MPLSAGMHTIYSHLGLIDGEYVCIYLHRSLVSKSDCLALGARSIYTPEDAVESYYWQLQATASKSQLYLHVAAVRRQVKSETLGSICWLL